MDGHYREIHRSMVQRSIRVIYLCDDSIDDWICHRLVVIIEELREIIRLVEESYCDFSVLYRFTSIDGSCVYRCDWFNGGYRNYESTG